MNEQFRVDLPKATAGGEQNVTVHLRAPPTLSASHAAYNEDFYAWAAEQTALLRAGHPYGADLANIAEEIEDLGKAERRALESHIGTVIEHLMKLEASPARLPHYGWRSTVIRARNQIRRVLADSPSLRRLVPDIITEGVTDARRVVAQDLADYGEAPDRLTALSYSEDQVLGDWLPE